MAPCLVCRFLCTALLFTAVACQQDIYAQQVDLRKDIKFFRQKLPEYQQWLRQNGLDHIFIADSVSVAPRKATLYLRAAYKGARVCDSLQCAWQALEKYHSRVYGSHFRERLLHKWAFFAEVQETQAEVVVRCHDPAHFMARINSKNGLVPVEGRNVRAGSVTQVDLPASLAGINNGDNSALITGKKVAVVCNNARSYLVNTYKTKGTPILWKAKVDTSYTAIDEFVLEVTHLSNEISPEGYYEYHRIYVRGIQKGEDVELHWDFQGKYGSGILFPPRKNDYKDLSVRYKENVEEYQKRLFKKLMDYLRR